MESLMTMIDDIKTQITDSDYKALCDKMKELYDHHPTKQFTHKIIYVCVSQTDGEILNDITISDPLITYGNEDIDFYTKIYHNVHCHYFEESTDLGSHRNDKCVILSIEKL